MARQSSLKKLPPEVLEAVNTAIREGRTIAQIVDLIAARGESASKSAVGRFKQSAEAAMEQYRQAQAMAKVWAGSIKDDPESDVARLATQVLNSVALSTANAMAQGEDPALPEDVMMLGKALDHLSRAQRGNVDTAAKIREQVRKEAAAVVGEMAKSTGMSEDQAQLWRAKVLGVRQ